MQNRYRAKTLSGKIAVWTMRKIFNFSPISKNGGITGMSIRLAKKKFYIFPPNISNQCFKIKNIPVEKVTSKNSENSQNVIIILHGGGYQAKLSDIYRKTATKLSKITNGFIIFNIDYSTAPENKYPTQLNEVFTVYCELIKQFNPNNITILGDSAGGNLALSLTNKIIEEKKPLFKSLILFSPWTDLSSSSNSFYSRRYVDALFGIEKKDDYELEKEKMIKEMCYPFAGNIPLTDSRVSPIYLDFIGFPQMLIQVGTAEILYDDSAILAEKAKNAGCIVKFTSYAGMFHCFQLISNCSEQRRAWKEVKKYLKKIYKLK